MLPVYSRKYISPKWIYSYLKKKVWYKCMCVWMCTNIYTYWHSCTFSQLLWGTQNCTLKIFLWDCFVFIDYILSFSLHPTSWSLYDTHRFLLRCPVSTSLWAFFLKRVFILSCYFLPLFHSLAEYEIKVLELTKIHISRKRSQIQFISICEWMGFLF